MKMKTSVVSLALVMIGSACSGEEKEPGAIFKKAIAAYESMDTYSAEGTIISDIDNGGVKMSPETAFSMKLKKPNLALNGWDQRAVRGLRPHQSRSVWNNRKWP